MSSRKALRTAFDSNKQVREAILARINARISDPTIPVAFLHIIAQTIESIIEDSKA